MKNFLKKHLPVALIFEIIGIIIGLKNKEAIRELWEVLENSLSKIPEKTA